MISASPSTDRTLNLGPIEQIPPGEGRRFQIGNVPVAVFRARDGQVFATQALCTHKGGPLMDGVMGAGKIVCPLHSYKFDLATGAPLGHTCKALKTYPVSLSADGDILLSIEG